MTLQLNQTGCVLTGYLTIDPPLAGSGQLAGTITNEHIEFQVRAESGESWEIQFEGAMDEIESLSGTYFAPSVPNVSVEQHGRWYSESPVLEGLLELNLSVFAPSGIDYQFSAMIRNMSQDRTVTNLNVSTTRLNSCGGPDGIRELSMLNNKSVIAPGEFGFVVTSNSSQWRKPSYWLDLSFKVKTDTEELGPFFRTVDFPISGERNPFEGRIAPQTEIVSRLLREEDRELQSLPGTHYNWKECWSIAPPEGAAVMKTPSAPSLFYETTIWTTFTSPGLTVFITTVPFDLNSYSNDDSVTRSKELCRPVFAGYGLDIEAAEAHRGTWATDYVSGFSVWAEGVRSKLACSHGTDPSVKYVIEARSTAPESEPAAAEMIGSLTRLSR